MTKNRTDKKCLYFLANSFAKTMGELAETAFAETGFSYPYGYLLLIIIDNPNLIQSELAKRTNVKAPTVTRFIDKLERQGFITRNYSGRICTIEATEKGQKQREKIAEALKNLHNTYFEILGEETAKKLSEDIFEADKKLLK